MENAMTHPPTYIPAYLADPIATAAVMAGWRKQAVVLRSHASALGLPEAHQRALLADADRCDAKARRVAHMANRLRNLKAAA